jgi:hypothetical protein
MAEKLQYSDTSLNWTLRKPVLPEYLPIFKVLPNISLQRKSHKAGHPSKLAIFFVPSAGRFREVSLYYIYLFLYRNEMECCSHGE